MGNTLFSDFEPVSAKAFKQKIQYDLKGAEYNETLVWHSEEGINVKPFYHREDTTAIAVPGQPDDWKIGDTVFILDPGTSAETAIERYKKGAESLIFEADNRFNIPDLLNNLPDEPLSLYFELNFLDTDFNINLVRKANDKGYKIYLKTDIVGNLARSGNWFSDLKSDFEQLGELLLNAECDNVIAVDTALYQNAGATIIQQLAYAISHANEYLNHYGEKLKDQKLTFRVATGSNYFFEIAKIRALRLLYASLAKEYNLEENCHITALPSYRNKVIYDYNTNMLRTTTECMSAILGGADLITNLAYDTLYHKTNEFGSRIARNQLLILKKESYMDQVSNPAEGTYYIEYLTEQIAEKALALFKEIEAGGGFLKQLKAGLIQKKIKESAEKEQKRFNEGEKIVLGINKHPNPADKMKNELELYPFVKIKPRKTILEPVIPKRLAEEWEQKRLKEEDQD